MKKIGNYLDGLRDSFLTVGTPMKILLYFLKIN